MKFFLLLLIFSSLRSIAWAVDCENEKPLSEYKPSYAKLFSIRYYKDFKIVDSLNDHVIVTDNKTLSCSTKLTVMTAHAKRLIATSTTHLPFLKTFSLEKSLVGFQGIRYIFNPDLRKQKIKDIHFQLNPEELLSLKPDLVMAYSANLASEKKILDLRKVGVPIVLNRDFEEKHPLARAEWMIFSSAFFSKDEEAKKIFKEIEDNYKKISSQNAVLVKRPLVLVGDIQNGKWATCGGKSDLAILIQDAGGKIFLDNNSSETQYLSLEKILSLKEIPQIWLTQNIWNNTDLIKNDPRYKKMSHLPIYNNNHMLNAEGFNDFWETGVSRPDLLLKDLHSLFYPDKNLKHQLIWYKKLQ